MNNSTQTIFSYLLFLINNVVWLKETRHEKKMSNWFLKVEMFMCNLASFLSYGAHILECIWSSAFWLYVGPWMKNCIMRILSDLLSICQWGDSFGNLKIACPSVSHERLDFGVFIKSLNVSTLWNDSGKGFLCKCF